MLASTTGVFCVSVDGPDPNACSMEATRRQRDLAELFDRTRIPSNWLLGGNALSALPSKLELTVPVPRSISRGELLEHLRKAKSQLLSAGRQVFSIVADPCQAVSMWNLLVRHGCVTVRPRSTEPLKDDKFRSIRGGLWLAPLSCSFVGGSRHSVRSSFNVCQRKLVAAARAGRLFHVGFELDNARESWPEEIEAFRALLLTAYEEKARGNLQFATLSELPKLLGRLRSSQPMDSILRAA